ncbi:putative efflux protein, MATE family [Lachnospiraceae bacterium KH1T2]|nr:putative efflux protein, MATE family [Lachnospiraceae bacterium KH1T2]
MRKKSEINMLEGSIFDKLCMVAIPLALSSILQQLFNAADVAVVGKFSTSAAMAAVGSNAPVINIIVSLFTGLSVGANVVIADFIGKDKKERVSDAVHTSVLLSLISGVIVLFIGIAAARPILEALSTPTDVLELAVEYLRFYFIGMPFLMIYNFGSAILRSVGDSKRPLYCLAVSGIINIFLNLFFVIYCDMSAAGVGLATTISNGFGAYMIIKILREEQGVLHLDMRKLRIDKECLIKTIKIGGPAGLQGTIFSFSNTVIQAAINFFGAACIAGNSAALNFEYISYFVVNGFAQSCMTFVSQNYAAGNFERCKKIFRIAMFSAVGFCAIVAGTFTFFREQLLHLFTSDEEVIRYGIVRTFCIAMLEPMTASYEISGASLRGIGHSMLPAVISMIGCCGVRLVYIYFTFGKWTSFAQVACVYPLTWVVTGAATLIAYIVIAKKVYNK